MRIILLCLGVGLLSGCASPASLMAVKPVEWVQQEKQGMDAIAMSEWSNHYPTIIPLLQGAIQSNDDMRTQLLTWTSLAYTSRNIEKSTIPVVDGTITTVRNADTKTTTSTGALALTGVIDIFGRIRQEGLSAKEAAESSWWQYVYARNTVLNTVIKQALTASYYAHKKDLYHKRMQSQEAFYRTAVAEHMVGRIPATEVYQQEQQWKAENVAYLQAVNDYDDAINALVRWTHKPIAVVEKAVQGISLKDPQLSVSFFHSDVLLTRPDVSAAWKNAESSTYARLGADRLRYPTVTFGGQWSLQNIHTMGASVTNEGFSIGPLTISIPLWDNGVIARKQQLAAATEYDAWQKVVGVIISAVAEYEHNQRVLKTAAQEWQWQKKTIEQQRKTYAYAQQAYVVGRGSKNTMMNEEMKYEQAQLAGEAAVLRWWQNYADVQYSVGVF